MHLLRSAPSVLALALLVTQLPAAEPTEVKTLLTERGKLLLSEDFNQPLGKEWKAGKGKWEIVEGALQAKELKTDMHGAVARHSLVANNFVIQYAFKVDGAKQTSLSINDANGHCCRVLVSAKSFTVQKDSNDKNLTDISQILEKRELALKAGEWHTLLLELQGKEIVARLDGDLTVFGAHDALDVKKVNFGLTVAGESVSFKNLRVWEATPNKTWEATKAKLLEAKSKAAAGSK